MDYTTGQVLLTAQGEAPMHPSSMTKLMVAYLAFETLKYGKVSFKDQFIVSRRARQMEGSRMFLEERSCVSFEDLLKGVVVLSGNDACVALAEAICGSEEACAAEMTKYAHSFGALHTHFVNSSGLPAPGHFSTARDIAIISSRLIKDFFDFPAFRDLFLLPFFTHNKITQPNTNQLLERGLGVDGLKTGSSSQGGFGIAATAEQGDRRLILVINGLDSKQERVNESSRLLEWGFRFFENKRLFAKDTPVKKFPVWMGDQAFVEAYSPQDIVVTLPKDREKFNDQIELYYEYQQPLKAPIKKGDVVGYLKVALGQLPETAFPLLARDAINEAGFFGRIKNFIYYIMGKFPSSNT